jgi:hypothetical protein
MGARCPRFPPDFWAVTWESGCYVLTQVGVKTDASLGQRAFTSEELASTLRLQVSESESAVKVGPVGSALTDGIGISPLFGIFLKSNP